MRKVLGCLSIKSLSKLQHCLPEADMLYIKRMVFTSLLSQAPPESFVAGSLTEPECTDSAKLVDQCALGTL